MNSDELTHYGVLGMKWGVRRYQPYSGGKKGKEIGAAAEAKRQAGMQRTYDKSVKKLNKIDKQYQKAQEKANKGFEKAERKANRFLFPNEKAAKKALDRARVSQYKANQAAAKGKKWVDAMIKNFGGAGVEVDDEVRKKGERFVAQMNANSLAMYYRGAVPVV